MLQNMDPFESLDVIKAPLNSNPGGACVSVRIARTDEHTSMMMQRFTVYVIEVNDFGRLSEVSHRYGDFEALHKELLTELPALNLPPLPPKGVDGTDMAVVAMRKVELEKLLHFMLQSPDVLLEKTLALWKFLNLPNPTVIALRFIQVPKSRSMTLKTLTKLNDAKYKEDVFRLGHQGMTDLLLEGLRELVRGTAEGHWAGQKDGRTYICQLLAGALGCSEATRARLLDQDIVALLLSLVERDEAALEDARTALNVVVAKEAEQFATLLSTFLNRGGLSQLLVLAQRHKSQEFVAKLLWLSWDTAPHAQFAQPGGQGLRLLKALIQSPSATCALLGGVLLSGIIASGQFDAEPSHRAQALGLVRGVLSAPDAASDTQFSKTLCGANAPLARLAGLLKDADLAPMILGLLCAAKPSPAKLQRIVGNLTTLMGDRSSVHSEETRAKAAELLLHIQGGGTSSSAAGPFGSTSTSSAPAAMELDSCDGIVTREEALESTLRGQLEDGVVKNRQALENTGQGMVQLASIAKQRLRKLPQIEFDGFDRSFSSFKVARESLEKLVRESEFLHRDMERQLAELQNARPSGASQATYKERLLAA